MCSMVCHQANIFNLFFQFKSLIYIYKYIYIYIYIYIYKQNKMKVIDNPTSA